MRRGALWVAVLLLFSVLAAGCFGQKSPEDVVGDLSETLDKMKGYKTNAVLTLQTGATPQEYDVQVWYEKPANYRVALTSKQRGITQIILRNDEGVFVLTPHLNKSFRFQSGWPENNGPLYLYETLVRSIIDDPERQVKFDNNQYVFDVKANYSGNRSFSRQKIWLTEDLKPTRAAIMDSNMSTLVEITFTEFTFDPEFDQDAFDKERNMTSALTAIPVMAGGDGSVTLPQGPFGVIEPAYVPDGVQKVGEEQVQRGEETDVVLDYRGTYNYRLIESRPTTREVWTEESGIPLQLAFGVGVLTETRDGRRVLQWEVNGVEFVLTGDLPEEEMVKVANSTYEVSGK